MQTVSNRYAVHVILFYRRGTESFNFELHAPDETTACGMGYAAARHYSNRRNEIEDRSCSASLIEAAD